MRVRNWRKGAIWHIECSGLRNLPALNSWQRLQSYRARIKSVGYGMFGLNTQRNAFWDIGLTTYGTPLGVPVRSRVGEGAVDSWPSLPLLSTFIDGQAWSVGWDNPDGDNRAMAGLYQSLSQPEIVSEMIFATVKDYARVLHGSQPCRLFRRLPTQREFVPF